MLERGERERHAIPEGNGVIAAPGSQRPGVDYLDSADVFKAAGLLITTGIVVFIYGYSMALDDSLCESDACGGYADGPPEAVTLGGVLA